jgi:hypothetical protein
MERLDEQIRHYRDLSEKKRQKDLAKATMVLKINERNRKENIELSSLKEGELDNITGHSACRIETRPIVKWDREKEKEKEQEKEKEKEKEELKKQEMLRKSGEGLF